MLQANTFRFITLLVSVCIASSTLMGAPKKKASSTKRTAKTSASRSGKSSKKKALSAKQTAHSKRLAAAMVPATHNSARHSSRIRLRKFYNPWTEPDFANSTERDFIDGEDLTVRRAAVEALGPFNGSVVAVDPNTGRILTMVNQPLALKSGFQPCSTIKIVAALAGLSEGAIERNTVVHFTRRFSLSLTQAIAKSNNPFFARIGVALGFNRVSEYAKRFGLGEKAGYNIQGEQPGTLPDDIPSGGMGMMTSFGEGISLTPLQLAGLMSAIANNGTLYYLQYPRSQKEASEFVPRVKRRLDIAKYIPDIKPGMMGAVEYGTARRANYDPNEPILGKTGTCTDSKSPTHLGWFGSFNDVGKNKVVVVVLLVGGRAVNGPVASGVAGQVYRNLSKVNYFQQDRPSNPVALVSTGNCCTAGTN